MQIPTLWHVDFQRFLSSQYWSLRNLQVFVLYDWGHMALARVCLVPAEAAFAGLAVPEKLYSRSWVVASEQDEHISGLMLTCISLYVGWRDVSDMTRQLSKLFMLSCLMSAHVMNFYQPQLALCRCQDAYFYLLLLLFSLFLSLYISVSYSGFTAVASLKYMIDPEHLPIPVSCSGTSLWELKPVEFALCVFSSPVLTTHLCPHD